MDTHGARLILLGDDDFPPLLAAIPHSPVGIWMKGTLSEADQLAVAIVGSRRCTLYGRQQAGRLAARLGEAGLTVVSGGAVGIDGEAHRGALRAGARTVAVLGCGLARCYPPQHESLFAQIVESGSALVSEYPMTAPPLAGHFPRRNRIISGLSLGVLIVEAARRSGALITARVAVEDHGREAWVVPGRVDSPASMGGLELLRAGGAGLVLEHTDVLHQIEASGPLLRGALERSGRFGAATMRTVPSPRLSAGQQAIVSELRRAEGPLTAEALAAIADRPVQQVMADLTILEIRGAISRGVGGEISLHS